MFRVHGTTKLCILYFWMKISVCPPRHRGLFFNFLFSYEIRNTPPGLDKWNNFFFFCDKNKKKICTSRFLFFFSFFFFWNIITRKKTIWCEETKRHDWSDRLHGVKRSAADAACVTCGFGCPRVNINRPWV